MDAMQSIAYIIAHRGEKVLEEEERAPVLTCALRCQALAKSCP